MRFESPEYDAFLNQVEARHSSTIRVQSSRAVSNLAELKIYVDGNVHATPLRLRHLASATCEVIPVIPGAHRLVVREADVKKPNRAESNTLFFELVQGEEAAIVVEVEDGAFRIERKGA